MKTFQFPGFEGADAGHGITVVSFPLIAGGGPFVTTWASLLV